MITIFYYTLRESLFRRVGLVLLVLCVIVPITYISNFEVEESPTGQKLISMSRAKVPVEAFIRINWTGQLGLARNLWMWITIFLAAPLLGSYLEKGWADLLLTKGVPRWQVLLGRMSGTIFVFFVIVFLMHGTIAMYFAAKTGTSAKPFLFALGLCVINFACIASLMALTGVAQPHTGLLVIVGFMQHALSTMLAARNELVEALNANWLKPLLDGVHAVLPRINEVGNIGIDLIYSQPVESWSPLWWSLGLFVIYTTAACVALHRKAI